MKSKTKPDSLKDILAGNVDIVGLDYITEYQNTDENVVHYYHCSLPGCFNEQGNPRQVLKHLKSYSHKQAWIQTKFQIKVKTSGIEEFLKKHGEDVSNFQTLISDKLWLECKKARLRADVNLKPELVPKNTSSPSKALTENTTAESVREHSEASPYSAANLVNADVRTPEKNKDKLSKMVDENSAQRINDSLPFKQLSIQQYQRKNAQSTSSVKSNDHQVQGICPLETTSSLTKSSSSTTTPIHTTTPSKTTTSVTAAPGYATTSPKATLSVPTSSIIIPPSESSSYPDPNQKPPSAILSIPADSTLLEENAAITSLSIRLSDKVALDLTAVNSMEQGHEVPEEEAFNDQVPENQAAKDLVTEEEAFNDQVPENQAAKDLVTEEEAFNDQVPENQAAKDLVTEEEAFNDQVPENQAAKDLVPEEEPQQVVLEQRCVDKSNEALVLQGTLEKRTFVDVKPEIDAIIKPEPDSRIKEENKPKDLLRLNTECVEEVARKPGIPEDPEMKFKKLVTSIVNDILLRHYRYAPKADKDKDPESFKIQSKEEFERLNQKFSRKLREDIRESYSSMYGGIDMNDPNKLQTPIISYEELLGYPIEVEIQKYFEDSASSRERKLKRV
ncbi:putative E3 ubiquitin-protein ligase RF4 isoform X2 [Eurytemora carolleeae]|uniref:putative E3 ubiquitin-protein ligase RF4 isoform X2 n=1 Tax=Eurytemora carolleeae TaxID=1294199 RepID=UPI000C756005|nr:putative E3 ubiquitin-protein ligase RF4 isoform X2 [Eurytemora carolleeae]|eukprot:XP_023342903.1 putative E3 ubiquitin-protein ligase RF4 isoform X2 [Eurytemora affinis]